MIVNLPELIAAHEQLLWRVENALDEAVEAAGDASIEHVQRHPKFKPRTGNLQKKQRFRVVRLPSGRLLRIINDAKYANAIDLGSKPHVIRARRKKALSFVGRNGKVITVRSVMHPGTRPYRFGWRATHYANRVLDRELTQSLAQHGNWFSRLRAA